MNLGNYESILYLINIVYASLIILLKIVLLLLSIAYFTLAERKVMASIQRRRGPNVVGFWGLLQPLADGLKVIVKESIRPAMAEKPLFVWAPVWVLVVSLCGWVFIPLGSIYEIIVYPISLVMQFVWIASSAEFLSIKFSFEEIGAVVNSRASILIVFVLSSLGVYGITVAGWSSGSKYAFLGGLRSSAQMLSYEVSLGLAVLPVVILTSSFDFGDITFAQSHKWFSVILAPCAIVFFISMLAETNRAPFDLPEAEAELVAGYNVEYSAIQFAMFFLGEYSNMLFMSAIIVILYFGGSIWFTCNTYFIWNFIPKLLFFCFAFIVVRASFPRFRYDQLMELGWKTFLPLMLSITLFTGFIVATM